MNSAKNRAALIGVVGGYLIYLAYSLLKSMIDREETTMAPAVSIIFIVFFTLAGGAALFFAVKLWLDARKEEKAKVIELEETPGESTDTENNEKTGNVSETKKNELQ